jgi:hypothetical protein
MKLSEMSAGMAEAMDRLLRAKEWAEAGGQLSLLSQLGAIERAEVTEHLEVCKKAAKTYFEAMVDQADKLLTNNNLDEARLACGEFKSAILIFETAASVTLDVNTAEVLR